MKIKILLLCLIILNTSIAQDECGQSGGFTGILIEKYTNGLKKEENNYLNGVKHGVCSSFYLDGTVCAKEKYQLGKMVEVLLKPDAAHVAKDYKTLHPSKNYDNTYSAQPQRDPEKKKWRLERFKINDTTEKEYGYYDNKLNLERIYIKGDKRYERIYYNEEHQVRDTYFNRNYEAHYLFGKLHGESISCFNNGNIQQKGTYKLYEPIGLHYTYYNNKQHTIKSITYYPQANKKLLNNQPYILLKKKYDTTGVYYSYELINRNYAVAYKTVVFTDTTKAHTWESHLFLNEQMCVVKGLIENGNYKITSAQTTNKKHVLKNGKYNDASLQLINDFNQHSDTNLVPINKGSHTTWIYTNTEKIAPLEMRDGIMGDEGYSHLNMFTLPAKNWKGTIKDGYLTGNWKLKETYYLQNDILLNVKFTGKFEKSRREGLWNYENELYQYDINYVDGKKEGPLKLTLKNYDLKKLELKKNGDHLIDDYYEGDRDYNYPNNLPELYSNVLSLMVGSFKNNELDGEWVAYYLYPNLLAYKAIYSEGILIGKTEEYNIKQQLTAKRIIHNNKIIFEKLFTPLGDEYSLTDLIIRGAEYTLIELKNNKYNGKYLRWNNYTGEIFEKGFYKNGLKTNEWCNLMHRDTLIQNYKNDTLNGFYRYNNSVYRHKYKQLTTGSYAMGKQSGLWKTNNTLDSIYKEEVFMDNEKYLITYIYKNNKMVKNGNGIITTKEDGLLTRTEEYYKDGKIYKTILTYTQNNQLASVIYSTPHGDSIAYYMPAESGTCIKNGTGMKTYFDSQKRISKIEYYSKGKIIKHDLYNDGRLINTYYYKYASDTIVTSKSSVLIEKEITKLYKSENNSGEVYITLRISNLPKDFTYLRVTDNSPLCNIEFVDLAGFSASSNIGGQLTLTSNKAITKNIIEITYKYSFEYYNFNNYQATITYVTNKKNYTLSTRYPRIN